jgi:hypothetical protein
LENKPLEEPGYRVLKRAVSAVVPWLLLAAAGCGRQELPAAPVWQALDPPAAAGAMAPRWTAGPGLSWLEPAGDGHRLMLAYRFGEGWSGPEVVAEGEGFFANWADLPAVLRLSASDGAPSSRIATWLESSGQGTYAYGVRLAFSKAPEKPWEALGWLHEDDTSATEHGFVSLLDASQGDPTQAGSNAVPGSAPAAWAFWLDGRAMVDGGAMSLRGVRLSPGPEGADVLDDRVCDCCQTGAAMTSEGPIVVYRDRSADEVRDISLVRYVGGRWTEPQTLYRDGWQIAGCPVNGPAIAAEGRQIAVAWFTAAEAPRVQITFSQDAGASFLPPVVVDAQGPLGRVDVALLSGGDALVSWLGTAGTDAVVQVRRVSPLGGAGPPWTVAATAAARRSGFPRLLVAGDAVLVSWVDGGEPGRLRVARLPVAEFPAFPAS